MVRILTVVLVTLLLLTGCDSPQWLNVHNEGPGVAKVTVTTRTGAKPESDTETIEAGGVKRFMLWFGPTSPYIKIEARWPTASVSRTIPFEEYPENLKPYTTAGDLNEMTVSPRGVTLAGPSPSTKIQNAGPFLLCVGFVVLVVVAIALSLRPKRQPYF